jgi:hypothetical protein
VGAFVEAQSFGGCRFRRQHKKAARCRQLTAHFQNHLGIKALDTATRWQRGDALLHPSCGLGEE